MPWQPPKRPRQGTQAHRAALEGGDEPEPREDDEDDEDAEYDFTDPDEGSPWITPARTVAMCDMIRRSVPIGVAADAMGFTDDVWQLWMDRGAEDKKARKVPGFGVNESPYLYFRNKIRQARAQAEADRVMSVHNAAKHDWRAAESLNKSLAPRRYNPATRVEFEASLKGGKEVDIGKLPTAELLKIAKGQAEDIKALPASTSQEPVDAVIEGE